MGPKWTWRSENVISDSPLDHCALKHRSKSEGVLIHCKAIMSFSLPFPYQLPTLISLSVLPPCFVSYPQGSCIYCSFCQKKHPSFPSTSWNSQAQITSQLQLHFLWEVPDHLPTSHLRKSDCPFVSSHSSLFFVFFIALRLFLIIYLAIVSHLTEYGQNIKLFGSPLYFVNVYLV